MHQIQHGKGTFEAHPGEANTLQELIAIDESTIDPEYLEDFRALKVEVEQYLQDPSYLFDSTLLYRIQNLYRWKTKRFIKDMKFMVNMI